jgi:hypothetical protein
MDNIIDTAMDAKFMDDAEQKPEEELAAHTAFDVEQQRRREAAAAEESNDFDFDWSGPDSEEKATEQRALVASFETLKKVEDDANEAMQQRLLEHATAH